MAAGFQAFDASGNATLDASTDSTGRVLGYATMSSNGSLSVPALAGVPYFLATTQIAAGYSPKVTLNTSTGLISWDWGTNTPATTILIYGLL